VLSARLSRAAPLALSGTLLVAGHAAAQLDPTDLPPPTDPSNEPPPPAPGPPKPPERGDDEAPDRPRALPDAEDLRGGHVLVTVGGGLWIPTVELVPAFPTLGDLGAGVGGRLRLGLGLNRYLILALEGGAGYAEGDGDTSVLSFDGGVSLAGVLVQALAVEPWVSYGAGARVGLVDLGTSDDAAVGIDVARLALGADFYPTSVLGFGPYFEADVGVRATGAAPSYAVLQLGLRFALDPARGGATLEPAKSARAR
jgi:hypothetical protein